MRICATRRELFCGPGGLAWGAINATIGVPGFRIVHAWANDLDKDTCETYRHNICPTDPNSVICADVRTLNLDSFAPIDALAFGFPCNDFSIVGEQKGFSGQYGPLYTYGVHILKSHKPKWFFAGKHADPGLYGIGKLHAKRLSQLFAQGSPYGMRPKEGV